MNEIQNKEKQRFEICFFGKNEETCMVHLGAH